MRAKIWFLVKYYLFWIVLSILAKVIFLLYEKGDALQVTDYFQIFYRGLQLDFSLGGYIMMLACLITAFTPFVRESIIKSCFAVLTFILLILFWTVVVVDLELFKNWGYHIDSTPLLYIKTPKEALASLPNGWIIGLLLFLVVLIAGSYYLYYRFISRPYHYKSGSWGQVPLFLVLSALMIIPVRGGFNVAPMNTSFVFFHKTSMFANQAAINPVWNFIYEVLHMNKGQKKFEYMPTGKAHEIVDTLIRQEGAYKQILKNSRPNIVLLLLESFTANAIEALGGEPGVTPHLNQLAKEGILFSHIYAVGNRSDRGMAGVISAYPSHPNFSLLKYPNKTAARPRFSKDLETNGYHTRFYYAGDINFGGFRSYVTMSFQEMVTEDDFSGKAQEERFKWGIHDEYMFERLFEDIKKAPQPFMYMAFNMSSHEPFEVPMETRITGSSEEKRFLNAIYYSDACIGDFIRKCKASGLWDNTLFILVADHGTIKIGDLQPFEPKAFHIPLLFAGGALNVQDTVISTIGSQSDIAATLLAQLGMDASGYRYSKNLLAEDIIPFAFYSYSNAMGIVSQEGISIYDLKNNTYLRGDSLTLNNERLKAYLQVLDEDVN